MRIDVASYLIDTNVLIASANAGNANHQVTRLAIANLRRQRQPLYLTAQVLVEHHRVCTRNAKEGGLGMTPEEAERERELALRAFELLPETDDIFTAWKIVVSAAQVSGKQVHDARLVAVCHSCGIDHILTFNTDDFKRFVNIPPGITVIDPSQV